MKETPRTEIRQFFSGCSKTYPQGWWRDNETSEEFNDYGIRFEMEAEFDDSSQDFSKTWKRILEDRFQQRSIYMKLSGEVVCVSPWLGTRY